MNLILNLSGIMLSIVIDHWCGPIGHDYSIVGQHTSIVSEVCHHSLSSTSSPYTTNNNTDHTNDKCQYPTRYQNPHPPKQCRIYCFITTIRIWSRITTLIRPSWWTWNIHIASIWRATANVIWHFSLLTLFDIYY